MNLFERMNEVRKKVEYVKKDTTVQQGGSYLAVSHDAITAEIRNHLAEYNVFIMPCLVQSKMARTGRVTSSGNDVWRYEGWYDVVFINGDDPTERFTMPVEAHADDTGDKAPGKSLSYATKYAILKAFNIETGELDESRIESKPKPISEEDRLQLIEICKERNFPPEETLQSLAEKVFKIKTIDDLDKRKMQVAIAKLKTRPESAVKKKVAAKKGE